MFHLQCPHAKSNNFRKLDRWVRGDTKFQNRTRNVLKLTTRRSDFCPRSTRASSWVGRDRNHWTHSERIIPRFPVSVRRRCTIVFHAHTELVLDAAHATHFFFSARETSSCAAFFSSGSLAFCSRVRYSSSFCRGNRGSASRCCQASCSTRPEVSRELGPAAQLVL